MADSVLARPGLHPEEVQGRTRIDAGAVRPRRRARGLTVLAPAALFLALAVAGPLVAGDPTTQDLANRLQPPAVLGGAWSHPLGTDSLGRDLLARVLHAVRLSLLIGLAAALLSAVAGVLVGLVGGMRGGMFDRLATILVELVLTVPTIVVGIVLTATLGQSLTNLVAILVLSGWIAHARVVRLQSRHLLHAGFVVAARASGAGMLRIARFHLFPNILPTVVVLFFQQAAAVMIWEASLTYLGIGLPIDRISLGSLIRDGQVHIFDGWWISVVPGLLIALAVIGFTLAADWIQATLDPVRRRGVWR